MLILDADPRRQDRALRYRVTQRVSSQVVIIEPTDAAKEELLTDGVRAVLEPGEIAADEIRGLLTSTEAYFVDAFALRGRASERPGMG